ncbi:MAG: DNA polymerase III subunit gamma/tau, partial [Tissierellia bacterium]|nr:DNA polymerase III subunit gamma/tau [Tissierellia bacterium]
IRDLRDKVKFLPVKSKYKVYIIDEVHMLSKGAFNSLLKTLEEPPEHLLFILATTESQKIPATILSRCQRFDLKRIGADIIVENMKKICHELNIKYEEKALKLIAANSEGAMRDAQSILDRCISYNDDVVDYETVINLLGTVNYQVVLEAADAIVDKDMARTMSLVDNILNSGKELTFFLDELIICFRNMLIIKTTNSSDNLMRISEDEAEGIKNLNGKISVDEIVKIIEDLSTAQAECKRALNPRVLLETKLIKMLHNLNYVNLDSLIKRIEDIESNMQGNYQAQNFERKIEVKTTKVNKVPESKIEKSKKPEKIVQEPLQKKEFENKSDEVIFNSIIDGWQSILKEIRSENAGLQAIIRESKLTEVINKKAVFVFDPKFTFHISAANQPKNKQKFKEILSNFLNDNCEVEFTTAGKEIKQVNPKTTIEDVYEDLKNEFGEIVEFKQED